ncbi:MAG: glucosamine 6-phosphate synthetase [Bdellovibrionota bacterium]
MLLFASEFGILNRLKEVPELAKYISEDKIIHLKAGDAALVNFENARAQHFSFENFDISKIENPTNGMLREIEDIVSESEKKNLDSTVDHTQSKALVDAAWTDYAYDTSFADSLKRCTKCVLPETMPYIKFDDRGVCSYCKNYQKIKLYGLEELHKIADSIRSKDGSPDCLVGLSGGRDSCYGLHYLIKELGLNPVSYTFDWGMVTDLARRNISRMCGKLGVEHILVSAHIPTKRKFIKQNVNAWLKRPRLGMIPLFMAGDKAYFYHAERLKKELNLPAIFLCENMLERTDFKSGFAGLAPKAIDEDRVYTLSLLSKLKIFWYYGKEYLLNPSYINTSLLDTLSAFSHYYVMEKEYYNLFKYTPWIEDEVNSTLINEYDWELATDTVSTWRIGDGTASFYNYIYYTVAGFTENDTFRSNQIREGLITRELAMEKIAIENKPRFESMQWYCETNGIDFNNALKVINQMPRLK